MAINSILTNSAAASALLGFNKTQNELSDVQNRLTTGQKVSSAKDNASTFAIAFGLRSDVGTFKSVKENLATGGQIVDSSLSVANSIGEQIQTLKKKITQAKDQPQGRELIQQDIDGALAQIKNWTQSATFNGINLLDGKGAEAGQKFSVTASLDRNSSGDPTLNSLSFDYQDLSIDKAGKGLGSLVGMNVVAGVATETKAAVAGGLVSASLDAKVDASKYSVGTNQSVTNIDASGILTGSSIDKFEFQMGSEATFQANAGTLAAINAATTKGGIADAINSQLKTTAGYETTSVEYDSVNDRLVVKDTQNRALSALDVEDGAVDVANSPDEIVSTATEPAPAAFRSVSFKLGENTYGVTIDAQNTLGDVAKALNDKMGKISGLEDVSFSIDATTGDLNITDSQKRSFSDLIVKDGSGNQIRSAADATATASVPAANALDTGDKFVLNYKDTSGTERKLEMTAVAKGTQAGEFQFELGDNAQATMTNLQSQMKKLTENGKLLQNTGFTFNVDANDQLVVSRDNVNAKGQILGVSTVDARTSAAVTGTEVQSAKSTAKSAQVSLDFGEGASRLKAGDEITLTFDNDGTTEKLTFRVGAADQTVQNGARVDGTDNTYHLNYRDVVGSDTEKRTGAQVAELLNFVMTKGGDTANGVDVKAATNGADVNGLSFRLYGGVAANRATTDVGITVADTVDADTLTGLSFKVGTGADQKSFSLTSLGLPAGPTATNDAEADTQTRALAEALNKKFKETYGSSDITFDADVDNDKLIIRDANGRSISDVSMSGLATGLTPPLAGTVTTADNSGVATNASERFKRIAASQEVSLDWDKAGKLTMTDSSQSNKTSVTSFNVNGNSTGVNFEALTKAADEAEQTLKKVMGSLGSASSRITSQSTFVDNMIKTLNENVSTLVDADMAEEAARLQALQTKSQLGIQALSTANQSTQSILSLFR